MKKLGTGTGKQICYKEFENPLFKEAANLASFGIKEQQKGNYEDAKKKIQEGLDKLKKLTLDVKGDERKKALNFVDLFQTFLRSCSNQEEQEKIAMENNYTKSLLLRDKQLLSESENNFLSLIKKSKNINMGNPDEMFNFTGKIFNFFAASNDKGFYLTENIYIRSEVFTQKSAKIQYLFQKYDVHSSVNKKVENLMYLMGQGAINGDNIEDLINYLIDVQNWFCKKLDYIKPCKYKKNQNDINQKEATKNVYKKFDDIKEDVENNIKEEKLQSKSDYIKKFSNLCNSFKDLKPAFDPKYYKGDFLNNLNNKKKEICDLFYNTIIKWFIRDIFELTKRFNSKPILIFENNFKV